MAQEYRINVTRVAKLLGAPLLAAFAALVFAGEARMAVTDQTINGTDYFPVIEPVYYSVSIYDGPKQYERDLARFSKEQRYVLAVHWYLSEVMNGGHDQFYYNDTGLVWQDARDGFIAMGIPEGAKIIETSAHRLGGKPSLIREERQKQLDESGAGFDDLDQALYDLDARRDLSKVLLTYIKAHRRAFYFTGTVHKPD